MCKLVVLGFNLFILFLSSISVLHGINVKDELSKIPQEDLMQLRALFHTIFNEDHGVYTLFGDKPVSLSGDFEVTPWENILEGMQCGGVFWKEWRVWEKYKHLFPSQKFILLRENSKSKNFKSGFVFLINKNEFIKSIEKNILLFKDVLQREIIPENILMEIEEKQTTFLDSIGNNQMLLGILLGYGKYNASLFNRKYRDDFETGISYDLKMNSKINLKPCGDYHYLPFIISSTYFSADLNHPETKALQKKYRELRGKISEIYNKGDFLEITLSKLTSTD